MEIELCIKCKKEYGLMETNLRPGSRETEEIACPYCGNVITRRTSGMFTICSLEKNR